MLFDIEAKSLLGQEIVEVDSCVNYVRYVGLVVV